MLLCGVTWRVLLSFCKKGISDDISFQMQLRRTAEPGEMDWIGRAPKTMAYVIQTFVSTVAKHSPRGCCWSARSSKPGRSEIVPVIWAEWQSKAEGRAEGMIREQVPSHQAIQGAA